jgi:hypothetical protein
MNDHGRIRQHSQKTTLGSASADDRTIITDRS